MTRGRRQPARSSLQRQPSAESEHSLTPPVNAEQTVEPSHAEDDRCPACEEDRSEDLVAADKENWVRCDACKMWYHWRCAGDNGNLERIDKWFCRECLAKNPARSITYKPPARKSSRKRTQRDYANMHVGLESDPNRWSLMLQGKTIKDDSFPHMKGEDVNIEWLESDDNAMREPVVIEDPNGLGLKMPSKDLTVDDIATIVGEDLQIEVIDVASQSHSPGWTLGKWAEYYNTSVNKREKVRNVISLEISGTKLADTILPPKLVRDLDWVEKFWPTTRKGRGHAYPKVQLYCLMGVSQAWTDWHIDFAGSSVYYHVLRGAKVFYFIRPTLANLAAYERWSGTELQNHTWLGDMVDEVVKVELQEGNTMIIPTGWIHAVYTPVDTLVFGGNFLHSYNVATQLQVREIEIATRVPKKFRFPLFSKLCWYAGEKYLRDLKAKEEFSTRVMESVEALADFLVSEARVIDRGSDPARREAKEQVPGDRVKDASALARELRWRVRLAQGYLSDDEERERSLHKERDGANLCLRTYVGVKRKHAENSSLESLRPKFINFEPRVWDKVLERTEESEKRVMEGPKPAIDDAGDWTNEFNVDEAMANGEGRELEMSRRRDIVFKLRKTDRGVERQRVERLIEEWTWVLPPDPPTGPMEVEVKEE